MQFYIPFVNNVPSQGVRTKKIFENLLRYRLAKKYFYSVTFKKINGHIIQRGAKVLYNQSDLY